MATMPKKRRISSLAAKVGDPTTFATEMHWLCLCGLVNLPRGVKWDGEEVVHVCKECGRIYRLKKTEVPLGRWSRRWVIDFTADEDFEDAGDRVALLMEDE